MKRILIHIPNVMPDAHHNTSLYELYLQTDYTKFNETFANRFDTYEAFLQKCGIVERIHVPQLPVLERIFRCAFSQTQVDPTSLRQDHYEKSLSLRL